MSQGEKQLEKIAVLMSTYNGEKYISEQIDSIISQTGVQHELYIRDDGSKDKTPEIIAKYAKKYSNIHYINANDHVNLGFNKSFFALIYYAMENLPEYDLFAFADQDDVWIDTKLYNAIKMIRNRIKEKNKDMSTPVYYYANKYWCNEELMPIHEDDMKYCKDDYFDMFMLPPVYGCTSVFNRALGEKTLEKLPHEEFLYDVYMFRLACTMDSLLIADRKPQMYYRRHGNNASGDAMKLSPLHHMRKLFSNKSSFHGMQRYLREIYDLHAKDMEKEQKKLCELVIGYDSSIKKRLQLLFWMNAYKRGIRASIIWIGRVVTKTI